MDEDIKNDVKQINSIVMDISCTNKEAVERLHVLAASFSKRYISESYVLNEISKISEILER